MSLAPQLPVSILLCLAAAGASAAQAVEFARRSPASTTRQYTCRFEGADLPLGTRRCLKTPQGQRFAECQVMLNMSTWATGEGSCP